MPLKTNKPNQINLKAIQMTVQSGLNQELMLLEFEVGNNTTTATTNIGCVKSEGAVYHSTVTRWLNKLHSDYKNPENLARSGKPKTMDSEAIM